MTGSARTRGFDGPRAEVNATTIRNPRGGSDATRTYLLRQPHDSNHEVGRRVARGTRRWCPSLRVGTRLPRDHSTGALSATDGTWYLEGDSREGTASSALLRTMGSSSLEIVRALLHRESPRAVTRRGWRLGSVAN